MIGCKAYRSHIAPYHLPASQDALERLEQVA
jgi:hypothetical protein